MSNGRMICELEMEKIVAYFKVLFQHLLVRRPLGRESTSGHLKYKEKVLTIALRRFEM
jgi:hypothetical protein